MTLPPGSKIGRFEVTGVLGSGGMASVYLAHDPRIDRLVAIKILKDKYSGDYARQIASRFQKEAKIAGRLQHPNIVTIFEAGTAGPVDFIAMEYVEGESLDRYVKSVPELSLSEKIEIVTQAARALGHAHSRGVIHRDIKPGNILITRDRQVKVADFGIGKLLTSVSELTRSGQMVGSPAYMSPEHVDEGHEIERRP